MINPKTTTDIPRKKSFSMSTGSGVKYAAFNSMYSTTASTSHISVAPQYIRLKVPIRISLVPSLKYHTKVTITAAMAAVSKVITVSPYLFR